MRKCYNCGVVNLFDDGECTNCGVLMRDAYIKQEPILKGREYKRAILNTHVIITLKNGTKKKTKLKNISARGLCVVTSFPLEINEEVDLSIVIPLFTDAVERKARVAWRKIITENSWKLGLDFGDNKIDLSKYFEGNHSETVNNNI